MAYNFVPKTEKDILSLNNKFGSELIALLLYLQKKTGTPDPITLDKSLPRNVKVLRHLQSKVTKQELLKISPGLLIDFGNGSRGGGGAANLGLGFERDLINDLNLFVQEGMSAKFDNPKFIQEFANAYDLSAARKIEIKSMGALNQRRSLVFSGNQPYILGSNFDIGKIVADVDVFVDGKPIHLSAKYGKTVTFFNAGVARILSEKSIKEKSLSEEGKALLDLFAIDHGMFCRVFNEYGKGKEMVEVNTFREIDKTKLKKFLMSGIGYGYHLVHKIGKIVYHQPMTRRELESYATPLSCEVRYPIGSAKRVDIFVETPMFKLKLNIRNKQGGTYPSHIMSDYEAKH